MLYRMWNRPPFAIVAKKSTGIAKPKDLEGRTIGGAAERTFTYVSN